MLNQNSKSRTKRITKKGAY